MDSLLDKNLKKIKTGRLNVLSKGRERREHDEIERVARGIIHNLQRMPIEDALMMRDDLACLIEYHAVKAKDFLGRNTNAAKLIKKINIMLDDFQESLNDKNDKISVLENSKADQQAPNEELHQKARASLESDRNERRTPNLTDAAAKSSAKSSEQESPSHETSVSTSTRRSG